MTDASASLDSAQDWLPGEAPRPLRLVPELPDGRTRRSLMSALESCGLSEESAAAVGRAVVKPDLARQLVDNPTTYRVPGAELLVIRVEVYTSRIIADATNPRTLNDLLFPAAVVPGDQRALYAPLESPKSGQHDFTLKVDSLEQLVWQLDTTMQATMKENTPRPPISEQGVMEPPLAVPARIVDSTGTAVGGAVLVREGSTRVSHAQSILGLDASAILKRFGDDRFQRELIAGLNGIASSSARSISDRDAGRVRVATMPIDLVIGVEPDPGSEVTLGEAVAAKVAQDHLNHKQEWKPAAKEVHLGEQCLLALHEEGLVTDDEKQWLAGRVAPGILVDGAAKLEDDRWVELLWLFTTRSRPYSVVIRRPIATVLERDDGRRNVSIRNDRVPLAVALAMRARRGQITEAGVEKESRLLENGVPALIWETSWKPSNTPIDDLIARAREESVARAPGAASAELAARAVWYLAKNGQLSMPRNDLGAGGDRRAPHELVSGMLQSPVGVQQLGRAVIDGRSGNRSARVLDDSGSIDMSGVGTPVVLNDEHVRAVLVPRFGPPAPPPRDPFGEFMDAVAQLSRAIREVGAADEDLRAVDDGRGQQLVDTRGIAPEQVADFVAVLRDVEDHLKAYEFNWRVAEATAQAGEQPQ